MQQKLVHDPHLILLRSTKYIQKDNQETLL